jgi:hypothetical protein
MEENSARHQILSLKINDVVIHKTYKCKITQIWVGSYCDLRTIEPTEKGIIEEFLSVDMLHDIKIIEPNGKEKRIPWNKGKRKPVIDEDKNFWCDCANPKLISNSGGRGLAKCTLCDNPWYH